LQLTTEFHSVKSKPPSAGGMSKFFPKTGEENLYLKKVMTSRNMKHIKIVGLKV
jgi:hypothetical protein